MQRLADFVTAFKGTPEWATMTATVEDSPWHREENVAVHTEMSIHQYFSRFAADRCELEIVLGVLAILFHDTGKPSAEETLDKKDGSGQYRRYAGHEQDSAVTFTECYLKMPALRELITPLEARAIRWTIENHLPYGLKDKAKRHGMRMSTYHAFDAIGLSDRTFFDVLRSDSAGRISDDHETKLQAVEDWIAEFKEISTIDTKAKPFGPTMCVLIGPSGSGKTTFRKRGDPSALVINADEAKVAFYREAKGVAFTMPVSDADVYKAAWDYCTLESESSKAFEKHFKSLALETVKKAKATGVDVYVDIVNASRKKRAPFVEMAKQNGLRIVAVEFWNTFDTLVARQATRGDKVVPDFAIRQQIYATTCAWVGLEAHEVVLEIGS
jgi:predicted kinase